MSTATQDYTLRIETNADTTRYLASFTDGEGNIQETEVSQAVYDEMKALDRYERKLQRRDERHMEHFSLSENQLHKRTAVPSNSAEDIMLENWQNDQLWNAIDSLSETQQRRFIQYYVDGMSCRDIAAEENRHFTTIAESIKSAEEKLIKVLTPTK